MKTTQSSGTRPVHQTVAPAFNFKSGSKTIAVEFTDQRLSPHAGSATFWGSPPALRLDQDFGGGAAARPFALQQPYHPSGQGPGLHARPVVRGAQAHACRLSPAGSA